MALRSKRLLNRLCWVVLLCSLLGLGWALWTYRQAKSFNQAVAQQQWQQASEVNHPFGVFAKAYALHQQGQYQAALTLYGTLTQTADNALLIRLKFNMANAYLQQALAVNADNQRDLVLPLVELAKQSYRDVLQQQPQYWPAKYNLERALQLWPDAEEQAIQDWQAQERGPRAVIAKEADKELP